MGLLISKEDLSKYVEEHKWLAIAKVPIPTGHQLIYVTPAGHFVIAIYNLKGDLENIAPPVTIIPTSVPTMGRSPLDFRGGGSHLPR
jgi:hypothetical protein